MFARQATFQVGLESNLSKPGSGAAAALWMPLVQRNGSTTCHTSPSKFIALIASGGGSGREKEVVPRAAGPGHGPGGNPAAAVQRVQQQMGPVLARVRIVGGRAHRRGYAAAPGTANQEV